MTTTLNNAAVSNEALTQSDWEYELDLMVSPSLEQLEAHLAKVPDEEHAADTATFLRGFLAGARNPIHYFD
jgi:hypothetical protein